MKLNNLPPPPPTVSKLVGVVCAVFALSIIGTPAFAAGAPSKTNKSETSVTSPAQSNDAGDSLNGFYVTLGPNIQNTKVDKTITWGNGLKQLLEQLGNWTGGLQPSKTTTITQFDGPSESKTGVLPQLTLGYMHPLWGRLSQVSLGVEAFYAPKTGSSNIASTTYGASGLLAYNFATRTQAYLKVSYVDMKTNLTGSQQFYDRDGAPFFGTRTRLGYDNYIDPDFKIDQRLNGVGVALGARQLLPFNVLGGQHLFAGGEVSYTKFTSKTVASPDYHKDNFIGTTPLDGNITNTKLSAKQYGVNLYIGYRF